MPYFCHVGNHLYVTDPDGAEGCHEPSCVDFRNKDVPPLGVLLGTVPGGHNDTHAGAKYKFQSGFDKGLDAYRGARDEGLSPKSTTVEAVEASHREVKSQKRALEKMKKMGMDTSTVKTAKGV